MKCTLALLAESPGSKTVSLVVAGQDMHSPVDNSTQVLRVFQPDPFTGVKTMITVVVKGKMLATRQVEELVRNFLEQRDDANDSYVIEIDEPQSEINQLKKSSTNSTLSTNPPRAISSP